MTESETVDNGISSHKERFMPECTQFDQATPYMQLKLIYKRLCNLFVFSTRIDATSNGHR
jgi:hypothetical protein